MNESKRRRLHAYPAEMSVVCLAREENSLRCLAAGLQKFNIKKSSLIYAGGLCLGINVRTRDISKLLPRICEHSDSVCIGRSYPELFAEHGKVIIKDNALSKLTSH